MRSRITLYPGQTRINSVRFIALENDLFRALVNVDRLFISDRRAEKLLSQRMYSDVDRVEITFHSSEREAIENAIMARLNGGDWHGLVFFGEDRDYAWTEKAIRIGRPANYIESSKRIFSETRH